MELIKLINEWVCGVPSKSNIWESMVVSLGNPQQLWWMFNISVSLLAEQLAGNHEINNPKYAIFAFKIIQRIPGVGRFFTEIEGHLIGVCHAFLNWFITPFDCRDAHHKPKY